MLQILPIIAGAFIALLTALILWADYEQRKSFQEQKTTLKRLRDLETLRQQIINF